MGLLLNHFNSCSFGSNYQSYHTMWNRQLNTALAGRLGLDNPPRVRPILFPNAGIMEKCTAAERISLGRGSIYPSSNNKSELFTTNRCFDICVCLGSQWLHFTTLATDSLSDTQNRYRNALGGVDTLILRRSSAPHSGRPPPHSCGAVGMGQHGFHHVLGFVLLLSNHVFPVSVHPGASPSFAMCTWIFWEPNEKANPGSTPLIICGSNKVTGVDAAEVGPDLESFDLVPKTVVQRPTPWASLGNLLEMQFLGSLSDLQNQNLGGRGKPKDLVLVHKKILVWNLCNMYYQIQFHFPPSVCYERLREGRHVCGK